MDSTSGQSVRPDGAPRRTPASAATRARLMRAAAELIAEVGWGRVTTRAVAERAGLPHGAVSYHFRGKQELLAESAMHAFEQAMPIGAFEALRTVDDLVGLIATEVGDRDAVGPALARLMFEAMSEAQRDPALRRRLGAMLAEYRAVMTGIVRTDQARGATFAGAPAEDVATLLGAIGDGLLLHVLLDPAVDVAGSVGALRALLAGDRPQR